MSSRTSIAAELPRFDRKFQDGAFRFTQIGSGEIGGKASGLVFMRDLLAFRANAFPPEVEVAVPTLAVVASDFFDEFVSINNIRELPLDEMTDQRIAMAFQKADMPVELLGDLRALSVQVKTPLAIRSSSLLEDRMGRPFAGVYATKMVPNNQMDADTRFRKLVEAVKFVFASTYFHDARAYIRTTGKTLDEEKMAVIIQEIVGRRHNDRFYPDIAGVARSYNYYPFGAAAADDGVVSLALGLGKSIVDDGVAWNYSPAFPKVPPPFKSDRAMFEETQTKFWCVNMGKPPEYDPVSETEYMFRAGLREAEEDEVLMSLASTYDAERDRLVPGVTARGPRIIDFAPLLMHEKYPLNDVVKELLRMAERGLQEKVEIEFAVTLPDEGEDAGKMRLGFLQVRPIVVLREWITVTEADLENAYAVVASDRALGNGVVCDLKDIVYVRPSKFEREHTTEMAAEIEVMNAKLRDAGRRYVLIGFGRWGSTHSFLGIPVDWSQISGAKVIVESTLPNMMVELSQGSHFFHNLSSFEASYLMVQHEGHYGIDWDWLEQQPVESEMKYVRHVCVPDPLTVRVDGRSGRGVILRNGKRGSRSSL